MKKIGQLPWFTAALLFCATFSINKVSAEIKTLNPNAIKSADIFSNSMSQVTNVQQLRDVAPTDWAYEALRSLVDRYGCIAGFPNQTYRGNQPLSRYEFAAGLNSCLEQIERLLQANGSLEQPELETIERLSQEFEVELASLGGRVDEIENRTALLEDRAFSTTTKLQGNVVFNLAEAFGDDIDTEFTFSNRVRLQLASSFTGEDSLFVRLVSGNIGNSFQDEIGTREGRFAYDGPSGNDIVIDRLHYVFPVGNLKISTMAGLAAHNFYVETFNSGLDGGGSGTGALTRFGERNPLYRQGIARSSAGIGTTYSLGDSWEFSAGYIAPSAANPAQENGLFNGSFSAIGQVAFIPSESFKVGVTYVRGYDNELAIQEGTFRPAFLFGGTGTNLGNLRDVGIANSAVTTNSVGAQFEFDITNNIGIRGWGGYTDANIINPGDDNNGSGTIWNYAAAFVFYDLLKQGSMAAVIVGAEPYLTAIDTNGDNEDEPIVNDVPIHVEALYKYQLNDNISITPGIIWLSAPNQNADNDSVYIGTVRTTFTF